MAISEARKRANKKYVDKQEEIKIRVPMGRKEKIKSFAESKGESLNGYITRLIENDMKEFGRE